MKCGIVIHGPEAIDTGLATQVIDLLSNYGEVKACVGGSTGVIAAIDAGLEDIIEISRVELPSEALKRLEAEADVLVLVNYCKQEETGIEFGRAVASRAGVTKPLVQVDRDFVISWNAKGDDLAKWISDKLSKRLILPTKKDQIPPRARRISGAIKGENVWINGVVVGKAVSDMVELFEDRYGKIKFSGVEVKEHVLSRLKLEGLDKAIVRSGTIRRTQNTPKVKPTEKKEIVCIIDHDAEKLAHKCKEASAVITVGDDTTKTAGNILSRYGVPVIGVTDGDEDGICTEKNYATGSVIFTLERGTDDLAGKLIRERLFKDAKEIPFTDLAELEAKIRKILEFTRIEKVERPS
ncbi:MAG: DUF2117 domain-containing protein [Candidatus Methanosuratincola verstraetei]|jgi:hypothetical protein|uniref:Transcriptional regulator, AcrR family n=1 Tax=Methanosuratincola subterraneus TaxID=2593994 RepID=A0A3S3VFE1_METS7|nr:MAG: Transcriptional regulator, AcrR family [Candidatus Methanosuratincola subterraneus]